MKIKFMRCGKFNINGNQGLHLKSTDTDHPGYISLDWLAADTVYDLQPGQWRALYQGNRVEIDISLEDLSPAISF